MSFIKRTFGVVGRVAGAPTKFLYPKAVKVNTERLFNMDNYVKTIYCPSCGESYLKLRISDHSDIDEADNESEYSESTESAESAESAYWSCPECDFTYTTPLLGRKPKETLDDLKAFIRSPDNKHLFVDESLFLEDNAAPKIANHMRNAYFFYFVAVIISALFFYGAYQRQFFFSITLLLFIATFVMNGLRWSYRAWQLHTGNVYAENPKKQFYDWLSTNNPLKYPNK